MATRTRAQTVLVLARVLGYRHLNKINVKDLKKGALCHRLKVLCIKTKRTYIQVD